MKQPKFTAKQAAAMAVLIGNISRAERMTLVPFDDGGAQHERITAIADHDGRLLAGNTSLLTEAYFQQGLTDYAVGYRDMDIDADRSAYCPRVNVPRRFEYATFSSPEEFFGSSTEDLRAIGADFPVVEYTSAKVTAKTANRGLRIVVDTDQVADMAGNWREHYTGKLTRRLIRNKVIRAIALLTAAATNSAKTWDTTAGKDPDQDVISELVTAKDTSGVKPNRVVYGDTAWSKRLLAHRAQTTAGGFGSANILTPEVLAGLLAVERVHHSSSRTANGAGTMAQVLGGFVHMFNASEGMDTEDPSNIKDFVSPCFNGQDLAVYERQIGTKLWEIAVEHYELLKITSTLGIRQFTVS